MKLVYKPSSYWHLRDNMTPGKVYEGDYSPGIVYSSDGIYYTVLNDKGVGIEIHDSQMIELSKIREDKINELGI